MFENRVSAMYLAALLHQGFAPGIDERTVCRVSLQRRDFGKPLDDVIVDFQTQQGELACLSLQVKSSLTISDAETNTDFQSIIRDCWHTFKKADFRRGVDRYGAVVGQIASGKARDMCTLCEIARASDTSDDFEIRFSPTGNASKASGQIKADIAALIARAAGSPCSAQELRDFLAHFVLLKFDLLHEGGTDLPAILNSLRTCLATSDPTQASVLWCQLCDLARSGAGRSKVFERPQLVRHLSASFRLVGAPSFKQDLVRLQTLTRQWLDDVENTIGDVHIERPALAAELEEKARTHKWVHICGLPGCGKSVVLRSLVETDLARGPVLFLKAGRLEGQSWNSFATALGLSSAPLVDLLVEIAATGSNTLYIDGIDRIEKKHRSIILDVVRAIMEDPLLDDWRVIASLRDTGIEPLRNWLGSVLAKMGIGTLEVSILNDEEAQYLAEKKPHLRRLLLDSSQVREIVRRPFFAKIMEQNFRATTDEQGVQPRSEVELIDIWWQSGGYDAEGQEAWPRWRALIELGELHAQHLSQDIAVCELSPAAHSCIGLLVADGILRHVKVGHTLCFSHDIFFEWAFFHALIDAKDWLDKIRICGEPPAVARVVELLSQKKFGTGTAWGDTLRRIPLAGMRSQWTRAWLLGPLAASNFKYLEEHFYTVLASDGFHFFKMALVWFQAEKTTPNPVILEKRLLLEESIHVAYILGWPSDFSTWSRLIAFLLKYSTNISVTLYPSIMIIFEVWQNAAAEIKNSTSNALLEQVAAWLEELEKDSPVSPTSVRWTSLTHSEVNALKSSLARLIMRSAVSRPDLAKKYLARIVTSASLRQNEFQKIVEFFPILAHSIPEQLVSFISQYLCREFSPRHLGGEELAIEDDRSTFFSPSPLREPFYSLFAFAPEEALRLVAELSNHAMAAWRQLHNVEFHTRGTPIPLEIVFPWGTQQFWGGEEEYLWSRGLGGPSPITCGYLALDEWALGQLEKGRSADAIIHQIVSGNQCIAVLGVAVTIALQAQQVTETTFSLVMSQRLLAADNIRKRQDFGGCLQNTMGFFRKRDRPHAEAVKTMNAKPVRQYELSQLVSLFFFDREFSERIKVGVNNFVDDLPFQKKEDRTNQEVQAQLRREALQYAELVDDRNYQVKKNPEAEGQMEIWHVSPSKMDPDNIASVQNAKFFLAQNNLWAWGDTYFETGQMDEKLTLRSALDLAKSLDSENLFTTWSYEDVDFTRGSAVAAVAAVALDYRNSVPEEDIAWANNILRRILGTSELQGIPISSREHILGHPCVFAARGLAAVLRHGGAELTCVDGLLRLITHPLEIVSLAALKATLALWEQKPELGWSSLYLAFSLCDLSAQSNAHTEPAQKRCLNEKIQTLLKDASCIYKRTEDFVALPLPIAKWEKVECKNPEIRLPFGEVAYDSSFQNTINHEIRWISPINRWNGRYAAKAIALIPLNGVFCSAARSQLLSFLSGQLAWLIRSFSPPVESTERRSDVKYQQLEWPFALASTLGDVLGRCSLAEAEQLFINHIFMLEDDLCWELLSPLVSSYICIHIYDAKVIHHDAIKWLMCFLERVLKSSIFSFSIYKVNNYDIDLQCVIKSLFFVNIDGHASGSTRFANGDWSNIEVILPVVDRFIRLAGWCPTIMLHFLELCRRSRNHYPAEQFAEQVLCAIGSEGFSLEKWQGTAIPENIANMTQFFVDRDAPIPQILAQKLLRILDQLVDMGDRRSAALQLSDTFRAIQCES